MKKFITDFFTVNVGLKIMALLMAIVLWTVVMRTNDPEVDKNFTTAVNIINEDALTSQGKYYTLTTGNTVTFRVTAKYSYMEKLAGTDFTAVADMSNLESNSRIPITITANRYANNIQIANSKSMYLYVDVGEEGSQRFVVTGSTKGECADGYAVNSLTVSPNVITVKGPVDVISSIVSAGVVTDVSGVTSDLTESVIPQFFDKEGSLVDTTKLSRSVNTVNVAVDVVNVKEVQVQVRTSGALAEGLYLDNITLTPSVIKVKGEPDAVNSVSVISLPADLVNLSNVAASYSTVVDITSYLPKGVTLVDKSKSSLNLDVNLVGNKTAAFAIPTSQIYVHNLGEGLEARFENETVSVQITGSNANLAELSNNMDTITGYIDAVGLSEGAYELPLKLNLGKAYSAKTINARIVLKKVERPVVLETPPASPSDIVRDPFASLMPSDEPEAGVSQQPDAPATAEPTSEPIGDPLLPSAAPTAQPAA